MKNPLIERLFYIECVKVFLKWTKMVTAQGFGAGDLTSLIDWAAEQLKKDGNDVSAEEIEQVKKTLADSQKLETYMDFNLGKGAYALFKRLEPKYGEKEESANKMIERFNETVEESAE